jgi:Family of unknown function (DUF6496)
MAIRSIYSAQTSAGLPGPADNYVAVAAWLRTLTDHPGLDLIIVLNRVGDGAEAYPSGLVMEIPRFHERLRMRTNAVRPMPVPQWGREPLRLIVRFSCGCDPFCLEQHLLSRSLRGKAKSSKGAKGGKVKSRKQAIAIGLSKARKKGKKVPRKKK